jgi:hypothetical protein
MSWFDVPGRADCRTLVWWENDRWPMIRDLSVLAHLQGARKGGIQPFEPFSINDRRGDAEEKGAFIIQEQALPAENGSQLLPPIYRITGSGHA